MYDKKKKELLQVCKEMVENDLVVGSSGNASLRVGDHILITPSSVQYSTMTAENIMVLDLEGNVVEGDLNPSVESPTHLEIYRQREDAGAVVHSHSIYTTALALLHMPLPPVLDEVVPKLGGEVRVTSYAMPGTKELAKNVVEAMDMRSAVLIANHGAVCCAKTIRKAMEKAILLERTCKIYLLANQIGDPIHLPEDVVEDESDLWEIMRDF
ncbi:MAG: class II aldolase/adducin family protein [Candidatus Thorarchaeota archaeon]|nr:MAG: class II aldolase/adducin family protein [Candidatus Thorarchaeota archaeon]